MSSELAAASASSATSAPPVTEQRTVRPRRAKARTSLFARGQPLVWLTGGALAICLTMIVGLLALVFVKGFLTFWPVAVVQVTTLDGTTYMGEVSTTEEYRPEENVFEALAPEHRARALAFLQKAKGVSTRRLLRTGNYEFAGTHYTWVNDFSITEETQP